MFIFLFCIVRVLEEDEKDITQLAGLKSQIEALEAEKNLAGKALEHIEA